MLIHGPEQKFVPPKVTCQRFYTANTSELFDNPLITNGYHFSHWAHKLQPTEALLLQVVPTCNISGLGSLDRVATASRLEADVLWRNGTLLPQPPLSIPTGAFTTRGTSSPCSWRSPGGRRRPWRTRASWRGPPAHGSETGWWGLSPASPAGAPASPRSTGTERS